MSNEKRITDDEFDTAQQEVDRRLRAAVGAGKAGDQATADAFKAFHGQWEQLVAACNARRADDRERADIAIRAFAITQELIKEPTPAPAPDPELFLVGLPSGNASTIRITVDRCIQSKTWRSECEKEARAYASPGREREQVVRYIRARYDTAGAGFSGRWRSP